MILMLNKTKLIYMSYEINLILIPNDEILYRYNLGLKNHAMTFMTLIFYFLIWFVNHWFLKKKL